jgi:hypothetical protein
MRGGYTANPIASKSLTLRTPCLSIDTQASRRVHNSERHFYSGRRANEMPAALTAPDARLYS